MKNLLVITLLFFSIGAMADDNYRCKFFRTCEDENCSDRVQQAYSSLKVKEGWFSNELFYEGRDYSKNTLFGENIFHWVTYTVKNFGEECVPGNFSKYKNQYKFDKNSLVLKVYRSFKEPQKARIPRVYKDFTFLQDEYLCEKIN